MRKLGLVAAAAFIATPLMALPAWAGTCPTITGDSTGTLVEATYTSSFSCNVGGVTFSNFAFSPALVTITGITSYSSGGEFGLDLFFSSSPTPSVNADIGWNFSVSGNLLTDAFALLQGSPGTGTYGLSESLINPSNNQTVATINITSTGPNSETVTYSPTGSLNVVKDQFTTNGANTSQIIDAFSLTSTPIPGALPLFATGLVGFWGLRKKRGKQSVAAQAA